MVSLAIFTFRALYTARAVFARVVALHLLVSTHLLPHPLPCVALEEFSESDSLHPISLSQPPGLGDQFCSY